MRRQVIKRVLNIILDIGYCILCHMSDITVSYGISVPVCFLPYTKRLHVAGT